MYSLSPLFSESMDGPILADRFNPTAVSPRRLFQISENLVAKIDLRNEYTQSAINALAREHVVQTRLFDRGFCVPHSLGVFSLQIPTDTYYYRRGTIVPTHVFELVSDAIPLPSTYHLGWDTAYRLQREYDDAIRKIRSDKSFAFEPVDTGYHNGFYSPAKDTVFLCDFTLWKPKARVQRIGQAA